MLFVGQLWAVIVFYNTHFYMKRLVSKESPTLLYIAVVIENLLNPQHTQLLFEVYLR